MADLLSATDRTNIHLAFKDLSDTFFKTPVTYELKGASVDRFNEDRDNAVSTTFNLMCMAEYPVTADRDMAKKTADGVIDDSMVTLTGLLRDYKVLNFVDSGNECIGKAERDYFTIGSVRYKVSYVSYDGPLDAENVLVIIKGEKVKKST